MEDIFLWGQLMVQFVYGQWAITFIKMFRRLFKPCNFRMISGSTIQYFCQIMSSSIRSIINSYKILSKILRFQMLLSNLKIILLINNSRKSKMRRRFKISTKEKTLSINNKTNKIIRESKSRISTKYLYKNMSKITFKKKEHHKNK